MTPSLSIRRAAGNLLSALILSSVCLLAQASVARDVTPADTVVDSARTPVTQSAERATRVTLAHAAAPDDFAASLQRTGSTSGGRETQRASSGHQLVQNAPARRGGAEQATSETPLRTPARETCVRPTGRLNIVREAQFNRCRRRSAAEQSPASPRSLPSTRETASGS